MILTGCVWFLLSKEFSNVSKATEMRVLREKRLIIRTPTINSLKGILTGSFILFSLE
jgi:hypothetical protein